MEIARAERLRRLPPYLFVQMARAKAAARARGVDVLDLGIGDPEDPTPPAVVEDMRRAVRETEHHRYVSIATENTFRRAAARWLARRFGVEVDAETQITSLIGTKEGIGHLGLALLDPGDRAFLPDPGYPVYAASVIFAGGEPVALPLREEDGFLPRFDTGPAAEERGVRLAFLNYPNNPTAATADAAFFERARRWAEERGVMLAHDAAYSEIGYDGYRAPSILHGARPGSPVLEFHSFSKTWNMCGWRVGFAAGNAEMVAALAALKSNLDSGPFGAVLEVASGALERPEGPPPESVREFQRRRDTLVPALQSAGWHVHPVRATFFVWARPPHAASSMALAAELLDRAQVACAPGVGFGPAGEGYARFSLTARTEVVERAAAKLASIPAASLGLTGTTR